MRRGLVQATLLLIAVVGATRAEAEALPALPDKGFVTPAHEALPGVIVFAKSAAAVTTPEKPAEFLDAFKGSDAIFLRAYLPSSVNNAFRAEGVDCTDPWRVWSVEVDGRIISTKNNPYFFWEKVDDAGFAQSTSIRFDQPMHNGKPTPGEKSIWASWNEMVAPQLTAGEHLVKLAVSGKCSAKNNRMADVYTQKPVARGAFKLVMSASDVAKLPGAMPKAALKNPALEKEMAALLQAEWRTDEILKVVIVESTWTVEKIKLKDKLVPQRRVIHTVVGVRQGSGVCRLFEVSYQQPATGFTTFGPTAYNAVGTSNEVACGAIK